jgi:hypothetical protein
MNVPSGGTFAMGKAPAVSSKKSKRAAARRTSLAKQIGIVLGGGALLATAIGTYLVATHVSASTAPMPNLASAAMPADHSGAIVVKDAMGTGCHRMKFNNATGAISDDGPAPCEQESPSAGAAADPATGGAASERYGLIANGFKH